MSLATEYTEDEKPSSGGGEESISPKRKPSSFLGRIGQFYHDVKLEMRKTSWPTRNEVWSTTVVVLIAVTFFGFYLWGIDLLVTLGFEKLENVFVK
jgi:preprotein translocase subunit SecE